MKKLLIGIIITLSVFIFGIFSTMIGIIYSDVGKIRESNVRLELEIQSLKAEISWGKLFSSNIPNRNNLKPEDWQELFNMLEKGK